MSRLEKHAWFNLGILALAGLVFALTAPHIGLHRAAFCFGFLGFTGLGGLFYRGRKLDERELKIRQTAGAWGHGVFWLLFIGVTLITSEQHKGGTITLSADNLPLLIFGGVTVLVLVESIAMLVLCKKGILHG